MKRWILATGVVVLQVLVLLYMAGERESIVLKGATVFLRTAPVDPRDPFRGDYVRLDYEISHVPTNLMSAALRPMKPDGNRPRPQVVYASLKCGEDGLASLVEVSDRAPATGLFLRGKTSRYWSGGTCPVTYGLEAYFTQQDKAKKIESFRQRDGIQVPLEMEVAISGKGVGVIKGYRWCALGGGLTIEPMARTNQNIRRATFTLKNVSTNTVAIVKPIRGRTLLLEPDTLRNWSHGDWRWVGAERVEKEPLTDADILLLAPEQTYDVVVDFQAPEWFVTKAGSSPRALGGLGWQSMFRLVYVAPPRVESGHLKAAAILWHGELKSRAFGGGRID